MNHPSAADLAGVPLFASMSEQQRAALAPSFEIDEHAAGKVLVRQGEAGYAFYVIGQGSVEVLRDGLKVRELGTGECFGELSIVGDGHRTATITAIEPVVLWVLFGTSFRTLQTTSPEVSQALSDLVAERLAVTDS